MSLRLAALLPLAAAAALLFACTGGGPERSLTEEEGSPTPTGTPAIFQRSPLPETPAASPEASPTATTPTTTPTTTPAADVTPSAEVSVTPVAEPFQVTVSAENSGLRIRETPSTNSNILGAIYEGHKAKVLGEARGQEAEPGKGDLWYQVELAQNGATIRGFVYAPFVEKVE